MPGWVRVAILAVLVGGVSPAGDSARELAKQARKAEKAGRVVQAYLLYAQAAAADPKKTEYWTLSQALRTRALRESNSMPASLALLEPPRAAVEDAPAADPAAAADLDAGDAPQADPLPPVATEIDPEDLAESRRPAPPPELRGAPGLRNFDLNLDHKQLFTEISKAFGLDVVFDVDYQAGPRTRFRLEGVDFRTAFHALQSSTSSFVVPLSDKLMMVYKDTQQKRVEAEPSVAVTLSLPQPVTVQEAQELARAVQQAFEIRKFAIDAGQRLVLMRDRVSKVRAAQQVYEQLLTHRSQVLVEVELTDMGDTRDLSFGMDLPTQTAGILLGRAGATGGSVLGRRLGGFRMIPDIVPGFTRFLMIGGGWSTLAVAIVDARLFASLSTATSQSLFRTYVRAVDSQPATVHIGDKYPIVTQQFLDIPDDTPPFAAPPTFSFEDLGLTLKITPRIHDSNEVSLAIESDYKVLGNGSFNGIPVISTRKFNSTVRLRNGEWAIVFGVMSGSEARTISGLPGLTQIPILSSVLASNTRSQQNSEALIVIKPHIIDSANSQLGGAAIYTGTESRWPTIP
jgi:hypothetical protein